MAAAATAVAAAAANILCEWPQQGEYPKKSQEQDGGLAQVFRRLALV
jgi:hypothetical protein